MRYGSRRCVSINKAHSLALESVYSLGGGEPGFTTYLPKGTKACVDYVWSSDLVPSTAAAAAWDGLPPKRHARWSRWAGAARQYEAASSTLYPSRSARARGSFSS